MFTTKNKLKNLKFSFQNLKKIQHAAQDHHTSGEESVVAAHQMPWELIVHLRCFFAGGLCHVEKINLCRRGLGPARCFGVRP